MIIVRLLSPEPVGWLYHHQLYSGVAADIVMESIKIAFWVLNPPDHKAFETITVDLTTGTVS